MPASFSSSFASAAAGTSMTDGRSAVGDWSRPSNGGTTFKRASGNGMLSQHKQEPVASQASVTAGQPSQSAQTSLGQSNRNTTTGPETRYSKDQLLDLFKHQKTSENLVQSLDRLLIDGWNPAKSQGSLGSGRWSDEHREPTHGPELCWDVNGEVQPLGSVAMTKEEAELFSSSVNSPIKPLSQIKEGNLHSPGILRRSSVSQQNTPQSSVARSGGRQRQDSSDQLLNSIPSPSAQRSTREEHSALSPSLLRRKTDHIDSRRSAVEEQDSHSRGITLYDSLRQPISAQFDGGFNEPSSPWSNGPSSRSAFGTIGSFGQFAGLQPLASDKKTGFGSVRGESRFRSLMGEEQSSTHKRSIENAGYFHPPADSAELSTEFANFNDIEGSERADSVAVVGSNVGELSTAGSRLLPSGLEQDTGLQDFSRHQRETLNARTPYRSQTATLSTAEPLSPTYTNPYVNSETEKIDADHATMDDLGTKPHVQRPPPFNRHMSNQLDARSNTNGSAALATLNGFGGLGPVSGPWAYGSTGTGPSRGFGDPLYPGFEDMGSSAFNSSGLFPSATAMANSGLVRVGKINTIHQDQARLDAHYLESREHDVVSSNSRTRVEDIVGEIQERRRPTSGTASPYRVEATQSRPDSQDAYASGGLPNMHDFEGDSPTIATSQQRQMVMPDRIRWIYRDPQGNEQGPWSGLEMHDWYKAGFFTAELQVKKAEDSDYEPLAQLIRRIGNSREPFLVPQIGIPHGPHVGASGIGASTQGAPGATSTQPPFANSFPSFGTTLTAEQQNALERRKQEEQYLMARQKEHLAAIQPTLQRQMQHHMHNQQLQHQSSAHSLNSQPSYGNMGGSSVFQAHPMPASSGPIQPPTSLSSTQIETLPCNLNMAAEGESSGQDEELPDYMERVKLAQAGHAPYASSMINHATVQQQQAVSAVQDRARLQSEQQQYDLSQDADHRAQESADRLEQYRRLRSQEADQQQQVAQQQLLYGSSELSGNEAVRHIESNTESLSLSEQILQAAANQSHSMQANGNWPHADDGFSQAFSSPKPASPMPAPTPQRNRQSVADALNAESQVQSPMETIETSGSAAAIAPWAKDPAEGTKGPSLKEIQAMEAQKAARQEEIASAARKAAAELERITQQQQAQQAHAASTAPALPSTANWATSGSPANLGTGSTASPWAKANSGKSASASPATNNKKTLAQIQKEEEVRKQKTASAAAAAAAQLTATNSNVSGGKRYAELASKPVPMANIGQPTGSAWTTVGAGGKTRTPSTPVGPGFAAGGAGITSRSASASGSNPNVSASSGKPKAGVTKSTTNNLQQSLNDEVQRWARFSLGKGLNPGIQVDEFVSSLLQLPLEADIISDSIYAASQTLDGRRFAEEFVRRRRLAERGVSAQETGAGNSSGLRDGESQAYLTGDAKGQTGSGGWNEVAKRGGGGAASGAPAVSTGQSPFKVVSSKKKGKK